MWNECTSSHTFLNPLFMTWLHGPQQFFKSYSFSASQGITPRCMTRDVHYRVHKTATRNLSWATWIQSTPAYPIPRKSTLILSKMSLGLMMHALVLFTGTGVGRTRGRKYEQLPLFRSICGWQQWRLIPSFWSASERVSSPSRQRPQWAS